MTATRDRLVYSAKRTIAGGLHASGLLEWSARSALRERAAVLAYHRVLPPDADTWSHTGIIVTQQTFARQMELLRRQMRILSLDEFEEHLHAGRAFPSKSCLVTFDDGWTDTYTAAWPVLERLGIPAVVFLPTRFIGSTDMFWQERLGYLISEAMRATLRDPALAAALGSVMSEQRLSALGDDAALQDRTTLVARIRGLKDDVAFAPEQAVRALEALVPHVSRSHACDRFMTWDQAREMSRGGVAFGVHGHSHTRMTRLPIDAVSDELHTARECIARELGMQATSASYPNGNWNPEVAVRTRSAGLTTAFSMDRGHASATSNPHAIPRMNIHEGLTRSEPMFLARLLGVF